MTPVQVKSYGEEVEDLRHAQRGESHAETHEAANVGEEVHESVQLRDFDGLGLAEQRTFHHVESMYVTQAIAVYRQYEYGYVTRRDSDNWLSGIATLVATPGGAQWWNYAKHMYSADYTDLVESTVDMLGLTAESVYQALPFYRDEAT